LQAALEMTWETQDHYRQLTAEAQALFGSHHYRDHHFLVTLSDIVASSPLGPNTMNRAFFSSRAQ